MYDLALITLPRMVVREYSHLTHKVVLKIELSKISHVRTSWLSTI